MMISIIICSRRNDISTELKNNISETIGCEYELIIIDNSANELSIFQAYNNGIKLSKGDLLCFCHDDIYFHSSNWGLHLQDLFQNNSAFGAIGVLGGHLIPKQESYYLLSSGIILQQSRNGFLEEQRRDDLIGENGIDEVATLDGLFMTVPKKLFSTDGVIFDEGFNGFHMYDMDICMQIRALHYKIVITTGLLLEHRTNITGVLEGEKFKKELHKFYEKWQGSLPVIVSLPDDYLVDKYTNLYYQLESIHLSHAYIIGCIIMRPIKFVKKLLRLL